jgi:hypothetical protein
MRRLCGVASFAFGEFARHGDWSGPVLGSSIMIDLVIFKCALGDRQSSRVGGMIAYPIGILWKDRRELGSSRPGVNFSQLESACCCVRAPCSGGLRAVVIQFFYRGGLVLLSFLFPDFS